MNPMMVVSVHLKRRSIAKMKGPKISMNAKRKNHAQRRTNGTHTRVINIVPTAFHDLYNYVNFIIESLLFIPL